MTWYDLFTYPKAARREAMRRIGRLVTRSEDDGLLELEEVRDRLHLFQQSYLGIRAVPVVDIVGSVGRSRDFDKDFLPRHDWMKRRWEQLERAFPYGDFPPIEAFKVGDAYFVVDGHHRVGIAKQRAIEFIDADLTEIHPGEGFSSDVDIGDVIALQQRKRFFVDSGLAAVRPDADITVTRPEEYARLLELVKVHGYNTMLERGQVMTKEAIAADWHDKVYAPRVEEIREMGLPELLPSSTEADIYLIVHQKRSMLMPQRGTATFSDAIVETTADEVGRPVNRARAALEEVEGHVDRLLSRGDKGDAPAG